MIEFETEWVRQNSPDPADPTLINWTERQAEAWIPFHLHGGRPVCPVLFPPGPRYGRNDMRLWGENKCADALVTCTFNGVRYVLLVERADGLGWAMPGGGVEPGEVSLMTAWRELVEETGITETVFASLNWKLDAPRWVPDPRGSMEAWAVTVVARCDLGTVDALPEVYPADGENKNVRWIGVGYLGWLADRIFPAHREILGAGR